MSRLIVNSSGSYVDIGAGTPIWGSNTYFFYKKGWRGITVDPIGFNINLHKIIRPRDLQYRALVSSKIRMIQFNELIPWELSTTNAKIASSRVKNGAIIYRKQKISTISLSQIYDANPIKRPAILSIDVEGAEMEVLLSNNWKKYNPDLICIEELNNPIDESKIRDSLRKNNYSLIVYNGVSSIYSWNNSKHLK
jgi:FkbM family methyltransferase